MMLRCLCASSAVDSPPRQDAMARIAHRIKPLFRLLLPTAYCLLPTLLLGIGCSTTLNRNVAATNPPIIRVRLLTSLDQVVVIASEQPVCRTESDPTPRLLGLPKGTPFRAALTGHGWRSDGT